MFYKLVSSIKQKLSNSVLQNILLVGGITLIVKLISFYKETLIASYFGLSELLDTYYIAILIPSFIQNVFVGSLKNLFIPNYIIETKTTNNRKAFQTLTILAILILTIILVLFALVFSEFFLESVFPEHSPQYYGLIRKQLYIALPCLFFWGLSSLLSGLLEIEGYFLISNLSQLFTPLTIIVCLFFFASTFGDYTLVVGLLLGSIFNFFYLLLFTINKKSLYLGEISINTNMQMMMRQYSPKVISGLLTGINPFVDQFFAAQLVIGSIAAINYGIKIPTFIVGIALVAFGNVLLPHFSKLITEDIQKAFIQLKKILIILFLISSLFAIVAIFFSSDIVRILFERNQFNSGNTFVVSNLQKISLANVPFYLCTLISVYFLTALNKNRFMAWISLFNLVLNLFLNFFLVKKLGVYGLAWSTTIVYFISNAFFMIFIYKQFKRAI
ncbi:murein biosynthesis integral membrane protein MurJ [Maribacter sp. R77961]|uniref:murein biosynthesis integral membrane protein MurJ n=1 Tax=Maribacter sp. R77961 TaxID=3093871 RepID=UPI0037C9F46D